MTAAQKSQAPLPELWRAVSGLALPHRMQRVVANVRLAVAGDPLESCFFPIDATVLIARQTQHDPVPLPVALIGREGLVGWPALLDTVRWTHDSIVVGKGDVVVVQVAELNAACARHPDLHKLLLRVAHNHSMQLAQSVVANLGHSVERRLSRWLAMLDDRTTGDTLEVTHDQLANLLNVRRATVTDALHVLEGERLIRSTRGRLQVRDRTGLETRAGQSYGLSESDYRATIGPFGKDSAAQQA